MKKILFFAFALLIFMPSAAVFAEEASTSPQTAPESINITVNVRYQDSLVYSGPVTLIKDSTISLSDDAGGSHAISGTSALAALRSADDASSEFSITDLAYYSDFDSLYLKCIDVSAISRHACDNWQYVVNSAYPPMGMDRYSLSSGDTVYFYFGNPRRVTLSQASAEADAQVVAKAESYDYMNNTWSPLSGATLGATQPNPSDPYSPLVLWSGQSGSDGQTTLSLGVPGTYSIGLAMDYYFPAENLSISPKSVPESAPAAEASSVPTSSSGGSRRSSGTITAQSTENISVPDNVAIESNKPAEAASSAGEITIKMDISMDDFLERYKMALKSQETLAFKPRADKKEAATVTAAAPVSEKIAETAAVANAVSDNPGWGGKMLEKIRNFFKKNK